jgi:hypothetical protein
VGLVLGIAMGLFGAGLILYFLLALLVFFGSNWARIAAMSYSSLIIVISAIDFFNGGPQISLKNNLLGLSLDILVVLALSSKRSRIWARRPRTGARGRPRVREVAAGASPAPSAPPAPSASPGPSASPAPSALPAPSPAPPPSSPVPLPVVDAPADDTLR